MEVRKDVEERCEIYGIARGRKNIDVEKKFKNQGADKPL